MPVPYFQFEAFKTDAELIKYLDDNNVKYVLVTADPGPQGLRNYAVLEQMTKYFLSRRNIHYELVKTYDLPDGYQLRVFKKLPEGKTIENNINVSCKDDAGVGDGIETISLKRNHTYVFYTGHFAVDNFTRDFEPGTIYIVQIENIPHESSLDVYNLPQVGTGMCTFDDLDVEITDSIRRPLVEASHCGEDCKKVVHVKWLVGSQNFDVKEYYRGYF